MSAAVTTRRRANGSYRWVQVGDGREANITIEQAARRFRLSAHETELLRDGVPVRDLTPVPSRGAHVQPYENPRRKRNLFGFGGGRKVVTIEEVRDLQKETADSQCRHGEYRAAQRTVKQSPRRFARARGMRLEGGLDRVKQRVKLRGAKKLESLAAKLRGNPEHPQSDLVPYNVAEDFTAPTDAERWYHLTVPALEALKNALEDERFYRRETADAPDGRHRRDLLALSQAIEEAKAFGARVFVSHDPGGWYFAKERGENPSGIEFVVGRPKGETTTRVQSVLFDARRWTVEAAKRWLRENGFSSPAVDRGGPRAHELRFRQRPPAEFQPDSFRTIPAGRHARGRRNPEDEAAQAAELFETFQGREPEEILELHRQQVERRDYAKLGDLVTLTVLAPGGKECKFEFAGDDVIVASSANAHQLYLLGGNQDLRPLLGEMGVDATKDFVELGPCLEIEYFTHKALDNFEPVRYYHRFGEETKEVPVLAFDQLNLQLILVGGAYEVKAEGIVN